MLFWLPYFLAVHNLQRESARINENLLYGSICGQVVVGILVEKTKSVGNIIFPLITF